MKILAIESSGMIASVAIATDEKIVAEYTVNYKMTHSQTLLPMIDEIVKFTKQDLNEFDSIAVSAGPGSFTGLRIGSATAKGLALATGKSIITVPTLEAMAYNFYNYGGYICPMLDARRDRVFTGIYKFENGKLIIVHDQDVDEIHNVIEWLNDTKDNVILLGDGAIAYKDIIEDKLKVRHMLAPISMNGQAARSVAVRAIELYKEGKIENSCMHKPIYLRPSQAESEKNAKEGHDDRN